jgi:hypothetical protein
VTSKSRSAAAAAFGNVVRLGVEAIVGNAVWGHADRQQQMVVEASPLPPRVCVWCTRADEKTCVICRPLHGRRVQRREDLPAIPGGSHPGCRSVCMALG